MLTCYILNLSVKVAAAESLSHVYMASIASALWGWCNFRSYCQNIAYKALHDNPIDMIDAAQHEATSRDLTRLTWLGKSHSVCTLWRHGTFFLARHLL